MVSGEQKLMSSQIPVGDGGWLSLQTKIKPKAVGKTTSQLQGAWSRADA